MTAEEYFGDWMQVIDKEELIKVMRRLKTFDKSLLRPNYPNIFKAFKACSLAECKLVMVGQDPYPQPGVATGILFGNSKDVPEHLISPSLKIIKESLPPARDGEFFDNTMEYWAEQGVLMINSALTCQTNVVGSHVAVWRPFISSLLKNISYHKDMCFILFGKQAQSFRPFLNTVHTAIGEVEHPAYFARKGEKMSGKIFLDMNNHLTMMKQQPIKFYKSCVGENGTDTLI